MFEYEFQTLQLRIQTQSQNHSSKCYSSSLTPPTNYILTLVKPFSFVWYVIPLLKTRAFESTCNLFQHVDNEKHQKTGIAMSLLCYRLQYLPDGGIQWLLVKPWISSIGWYMRYCTGTPLQPSKWLAKLVHFFVAVLFAVALAAAGAIRSK